MKKLIAVLAAFAFAASFSPCAYALSVSAKSAVLIEAQSKDIIYAKDENNRRGMASTTKIMTALVALENMALDTVITVVPQAQGVEGSSVYLRAGERITLESLLYALMLQSANDAAVAIAFAVGGSIEGFADMMNERASKMGLTDTHFENPHGLDGEEHYTTAYELALIAAEALENEAFAKIVSTKTAKISTDTQGSERYLVNHNRLLRVYDDIIGVKTGFTKKCGRTLVSAAICDGVKLICVTLDDGNDWKDHRCLLDHGAKLYESVSLATEGEFSFDIPVVGGERSIVKAFNKETISASLPKERKEISTKTELERFIYAGMPAGSRVGRVRFFLCDREIGEAALYTAEEIPKKIARRGIFGK